MNPVEHLLVAAIPVVTYVLIRDRAAPTRKLLYVVFVGSLFPDLIDKPLAYQWFLIPTGRAFAHSPLVAVPVSLGILLIGRRTDHVREGFVFVFAYVTHIVADFWFLWDYPASNHLQYLLWPLVPAPPTPRLPAWAGPNSIYVTLWTAFSITVLIFTGYLLIRERRAGTQLR